VKPNVKWGADDAKDHITFAKTAEAYFKGPFPIEMIVEGLSTVDVMAKNVYRTFEFKEVYIAKALFAEEAHHRALMSFVMNLLHQDGYPFELFSDESKAITWLQEAQTGTDWLERSNDFDLNELSELLQNAPMHFMIS
jgi:hypothetical protein